MKCPRCQKETRRLIYKGQDKRCPDCANPNVIKCVIPYTVREIEIRVSPIGIFIGRVGEPHEGRN